MLSGAKHLLLLVEETQKQILRFAQDDRIRAFSSAELKPACRAKARRYCR
jgi:hypothetical protein